MNWNAGLAAIVIAVPLLAQPRPLLPLIDGAAAVNLVVKQVPPVYPPTALEARVQGVVPIVVEIDADGKLQDARVAGGPTSLRQAALDNIQQWTFRAYLQNGRAKAVRANFDVVFRLP
jgi:TonB family protein